MKFLCFLPGYLSLEMSITRAHQIIVSLVLMIFLSACTDRDSTWHKIEETGVLHIGLDPTYPPFEVTNGNDLWGLDVDLGKAIASRLGVEADFTYFGYDGLYDALSTKQVDVLVSALVPVASRTKDFAYSESYFNSGQVLVVKNDVSIEDLSQLSGKTVAVELGSEGHVIGTSWQRTYPNVAINPVESADSALATVVEGSSYVAVTDHVSARLYLRDHPDLAIYESMITDEPFVLVTRRGDQELLTKLNNSLAEMTADGALESIITSWLDK